MPGFIWDLQPLNEEESEQLLGEIAARSGVLLQKEVSEDIVKKCMGIPLHLHYYGYYLLSRFAKSLTPAEEELAQSRLLTPYRQDSTKSPILGKGPDGRTRLKISDGFYQKMGIVSIEFLYKLIVGQIATKLEKDILKIVYRQSTPVSLEGLQNNLNSAHIEISAQAIQQNLIRLESLKLIKILDHEIQIPHPWIKTFFLELTLRQSKDDVMGGPTTRRLGPSKLFQTRKFGKIGPVGTTNLIPFAIAALEIDNYPTHNMLKAVSLEVSLNESDPTYQDSNHYIQCLCRRLCRLLGKESEAEYKLAILKDNMRNSSKSPGKLLLAIQSTFLGQDLLDKCLKESEFLYLSNLYLLKYHLHNQKKDLESALQFRLHWLEQHSADPESLKYLLQAKEYLKNLADESIIAKYRNLFQWQERIIHISSLESPASVALEFANLTPQSVDKDFRPFLTRFYVNYISQKAEQPELQKVGCKVLIQYQREVAALPNIKGLLAEKLMESKASREIFTQLVPYVVPFFKDKDQREMLAFIIEVIKRDNTPRAIYNLTKMIATYACIFVDQAFIEPLKAIVSDQKDEESMLFCWHALARIQSRFAEVVQYEIRRFMTRNYVSVVERTSIENIERCTFALLMALGEGEDHRVGVNTIVDQLIGILEISVEPIQQQKIIQVLTILFKGLKEDQQNQIGSLVTHWLESEDVNKRAVVLENISIFWKFLAGPEDILKQNLKNPNLEIQSAAVRGIAEAFGRVNEEQRESFLKEIEPAFLYLIQHGDGVPQKKVILTALAKMSCYLSQDNADDIGRIFIEVATNTSSQVVATVVEDSLYLMPFLSDKIRQELYVVFADLLEPEETPISLLPVLLERLPKFPSYFSEERIRGILMWILQQMENYHEKVASAAFYFFVHIRDQQQLPQDIEKLVRLKAIDALGFQKSTEAATAFLIKSGNETGFFDWADWVYIFQFDLYTWNLAFGLYRVFPDLKNTPYLSENYQKLRSMDSFYLGCKTANFHFQIGAVRYAQELLDDIIERTGIPAIKVKALKLMYEWNLQRLLGEEALKNLELLKKLGF